jgi:hypothetical protein
MIEDHLQVPFETEVLGVPVTVTSSQSANTWSC